MASSNAINGSTAGKLQGHLAVLAANVIFGLGVPVTKALLNDWVTPNTYIATRSLFAAMIFWAVSLFLPRERVGWKDLLVILAGGLMGFVVSQTLTAWALKFTSPVYFSLVGALTPIAVMLMAALFIGERMTGRSVLGVGLGILGGLVMIAAGWHAGAAGKNDLLGIGLAVLSVLTWAVYMIITRKVSSKYSAVTQMKWVFLISAVVTVPIALPELGSQKLYSAAWGWDGVLEMAFIVVCATALGYFLLPVAMKRLDATTVSIYTNLQPVVASLTAIAIHQDVFSWDKPVAAVLVLLGAYIVTVPAKRSRLRKA